MRRAGKMSCGEENFTTMHGRNAEQGKAGKMARDAVAALRRLPPVHEVARLCASQHPEYPIELVTQAAREVLAAWRERVRATGAFPPELPSLVAEVTLTLQQRARPSLRRVLNATGVILHTNLGRAPLGAAALAALQAVAGGYCNLEIDLEEGERGSRHVHVAGLLRELTGAEAALVVNNNAAAVLLALHSLARGKEVVVSRGELVEIGGSFRIPEVLAQSGARLVEVGTTNKTYPRDYEQAIGPETALLLKVHPSNYRVLGFTREVTRAELVAIGRKHGLPVLEDLGSGCLVDLTQFGVDSEPTVQESLRAGVDIVTFSGDKLLGGPQAGIILGKKCYLEVMKKNPLMRALRVDKLTLAALEATLRAYLSGEAPRELPVLRMLTCPAEEVAARAAKIRELLEERVPGLLEVTLAPGTSCPGGGALPLTAIPTTLVVLRPQKGSVAALARCLRLGEPPVVARVSGDSLLLDPRTVAPSEVALLVDALVAGAERLAREAQEAAEGKHLEERGGKE